MHMKIGVDGPQWRVVGYHTYFTASLSSAHIVVAVPHRGRLYRRWWRLGVVER